MSCISFSALSAYQKFFNVQQVDYWKVRYLIFRAFVSVYDCIQFLIFPILMNEDLMQDKILVVEYTVDLDKNLWQFH